MGSTPRTFHPIDALTLDDVIPAEHLYRRLERCRYRSFVRDWYWSRNHPLAGAVAVLKDGATAGLSSSFLRRRPEFQQVASLGESRRVC